MIGSNLLRYQDDQKYCIFDFETSGLNLYHSLPWQLSYAICTNKTIEKTVTRYPFYKNLKVSDEAARITRFDKKHYLGVAEDPVLILKDFEDIAMDSSIKPLGHNICGFDAYIWQTMRRLQGKSTDWSFISRMIDTLALSRAYRNNITPDLTNFTAWQYKILNMPGSRKKGMGASLGAMAREFQIPYDEQFAHDASYDINVNFEVFKSLIWKMEV